ncbi:hypothetical protein C8J57DRAFT_1237163 [Mycena rebaudengoi]|nr:hypothetical protein C8J57DRAFT_1237163 [Mycena rebaudengoi]
MRARRGTWRARPARNSVTRSAVDKGPTAARRQRIYGDPALRNPNSAQQKKTENIANFGCRALKLWIARRHNAQWAIPGLRSSFSHMLRKIEEGGSGKAGRALQTQMRERRTTIKSLTDFGLKWILGPLGFERDNNLGVKGRGYTRQELVLMSIVGAVLTVKAEIHYVIHDSLPFAEGTGGQFKAVEPPHIVEQLPPQVAVMAVVENEQEGVFMKQINTLRPDVRYVERHEIKPQRDAKAVVKLVMKSLIFLDGTQTRDARVRQRIDEVKAERYLMDKVAITAKKAKRRLGIDDGNTGNEENRRPRLIIFGQTGDEFDSELDV